MKIQDPPIKITAELLSFLFECTKRNKKCTEKEIQQYISKTPVYVTKAIDFLKQNLIIEENGDSYNVCKEQMSKLDGSHSRSCERLKDTIANNKQFVEYAYFISQGKSETESVKLVKIIYTIEQTETSIAKIFKTWIKFLNINIKQKIVDNKTLQELEKSIDNRLLANKFLKNEFQDYYSQISKSVLDDLCNAIIILKEDSEGAVNDAGRALEDFFRLDIAKDKNLTNCAGIVQITNELNKYPEYPTKLNNISSALGNVRSMGKAHGVDAKLKEKWTLLEHTGIAYIILIISVIKSYLEYKTNKKLIF